MENIKYSDNDPAKQYVESARNQNESIITVIEKVKNKDILLIEFE